MKINGTAHCLFEQSGTFKNAFRALGIPSEDWDILDDYGQTDHRTDLFAEIEAAYNGGGRNIFDAFTPDDLLLAFFPCIHFCDAKTLYFKGVSINQKGYDMAKIMRQNVDFAHTRERFFVLLLKMVAVVCERGLRMVVENPYNSSGMTYLENNFPNPTIIDKNRMIRGDYFVKPTGYWFYNCEPSYLLTEQQDKKQRTVMKCKGADKSGVCSPERSQMHPDYARNFIGDFILGTPRENTQLTLFDK